MATPRRGRVRSTSWCHLPCNLLRLQFLVAAAPLSVKWQTKLHERRRFATAQLLHRRDQGSCVSVLAPYHSHPPSVLLSPSLRLLLIKQVSCLPHPLRARMQAGGRNVNAVTQFSLTMSLFRVTLLRFMTFRTPTLSHAPPTISCIKSSFMATPEEVAPGQGSPLCYCSTHPCDSAVQQFSPLADSPLR